MVRKFESEEDFAQSTAGYTHVEWRSTAEILEYLGAMAKLNMGSTSDGGKTFEGIKFSISDMKESVGEKYVVDVIYDGHHYGIDRADATTLNLFRIAKELVDVSKISSSASVPQPIVFVP